MVFTTITYGVPIINTSIKDWYGIRAVTIIQSFTSATGAENSVNFPGATVTALANGYHQMLRSLLGNHLIRIKGLWLTLGTLAAATTFYAQVNRTSSEVLSYSANATFVDNERGFLDIPDIPHRVNWASFTGTPISFITIGCTPLTLADNFSAVIELEVIE